MKKIFLLLTFFVLTAFSTYKSYVSPVLEIESLPIEMIPIEIKKESFELVQPSHQQFLEAIGHRESSNNYSVVNEFGYMGRYQFGRATLKGLGIDVTKEEFISATKSVIVDIPLVSTLIPIIPSKSELEDPGSTTEGVSANHI